MPMWRCPHCGTPQPEAARCWVCRRSSTACGTCRHFRRSVAAQLGYCGLDRRRAALRGDEIRGCWEAGEALHASDDVAPRTAAARTVIAPAVRSTAEASTRLEFVPVGADGPRRAADGEPAPLPLVLEPPAIGVERPGEPRWTLWGEPEG